jgi:hypothetical protein
MIWMTWRQFRPAAITAAAALVVLAAALAATRPTLMSLYTSAHLPGCHAGCAADANNFFNSVQRGYTTKIYWAGLGIMWLVPGVLGLFWGAPLIARELESGTFRLAWAQSITRARWATIKLLLIGGATMATAGLMSLLIDWWTSPLYQAANQGGPNVLSISRLSGKLFSATGIVPVGYAAFAFALGAAAGVLLRRTIPAMAVTLGIFAVLQVLVPLTVRPHLIPPVQTTSAISAVQLGNNQVFPVGTHPGPPDYNVGPDGSFSPLVYGISGQPGAMILGSRLIDAAGQTVTTPPSACVHQFGDDTATDVSCLAGHGMKIVVSYQPTSRYWALQSAETGLYLVLAASLGGLCYSAVRRRQRSA